MHIKIPTSLTEAQLAEFQALYFEEFQEKIGVEEAIEKAFILLRFVAIVLKMTARLNASALEQTDRV